MDYFFYLIYEEKSKNKIKIKSRNIHRKLEAHSVCGVTARSFG
jgi:hypothetical protein